MTADHDTPLTRRSTLRLSIALGLGGVALAAPPGAARTRTPRVGETRAVSIAWLTYGDAAGNELGQVRPFALLDVSEEPEVARVAGTRALDLSVAIRNTGAAGLSVPPAAFALWGEDGVLYRPQEVYVAPAPDNDVQILLDHQHTATPIPPCAERFGWITYRVPRAARLAGLLFTPEPERVLVLADFSRLASVIID